MSKESFTSNELLHVMPVMIKDTDIFSIQIRSDYDGGRSTKWMNISPDQFMKIEQVLHGLTPFEG